jgi:hypothetical protein
MHVQQVWHDRHEISTCIEINHGHAAQKDVDWPLISCVCRFVQSWVHSQKVVVLSDKLWVVQNLKVVNAYIGHLSQNSI